MHQHLQAILSRAGLVVALLLGLCASGFTQTDLTVEADRAYARGGFSEAALEYTKVYPRIKNKDEAGRVAYLIGESYRQIMNLTAAEEWLKKAVGLKYGDSHPEVFLSYGDVMIVQHEFEEAREWYVAFRDQGGDSQVANQRIESVEAAALALDEPPARYIVENMLLINSEAYDFGAAYSTKKGDELTFSSSRAASTGTEDDPITGEAYMDLFSSTQDKKGRWSTPEPVTGAVNTAANEGTVAFDAKYKTMYFTRCVTEGTSNFACDIYRSQNLGGRMGPAEVVAIVDRAQDDSSQVGHPAFSSDNAYLLFASDMPGGFGGKDIWYVAYDAKKDAFGTPVNLGSTVNTEFDEMFPRTRFDGTLYFASAGWGGMGGLDICEAAPIAGQTMKFEQAIPMKYPMNSTADDFGIVFKEGLNEGLLTSSRPGGRGRDDIYSFRLPEQEFCYRANVYDYDTGNPLQATVLVQGTDGKSWTLTADAEGSVSLCEKEQIVKDVTYGVDVRMQGYIGTGDRFSTVGLTESTTFAREYFLKEIVTNQEYPMPLVLYPFNQATLLVDAQVNSEDSLNYLVDLLTRNESLVIQLESHTDSRGDAKYNKDLSQRRAQTCVDYLIARGIDPRRVVAVGKGEEQLLVADATIAAMKSEAEKDKGHQANRRTVFLIIATDFVPTKQ
jgi:peptidoglycan-associated lipoprotein